MPPFPSFRTWTGQELRHSFEGGLPHFPRLKRCVVEEDKENGVAGRIQLDARHALPWLRSISVGSALDLDALIAPQSVIPRSARRCEYQTQFLGGDILCHLSCHTERLPG
jgi:hypothetical protein